MTEFDPSVYPAPDLAIEIDITHRSIPRQPIYAALGVPELWRYDGQTLQVLLLGRDETCTPSAASRFPFLDIQIFESFIHRMESEMRTDVLRAFQTWVRTLLQ